MVGVIGFAAFKERCIVQGSFFMGEELSMVDLVFIPFVERMVSSMLYYKGFTIRGNGIFPGIDAWFQALEQRPTYLACRSDHYTHCHDLPPQLGGVHPHTFSGTTIYGVANLKVQTRAGTFLV